MRKQDFLNRRKAPYICCKSQYIAAYHLKIAQLISINTHFGLIADEEGWIELLNARNFTSHIYDDDTAKEIYTKIENRFIQLFTELLNKLIDENPTSS